MNDFIYNIRIKDLTNKYFSDIISEEKINTKSKPVIKEDDEVIKEILKQYENDGRTTKRNKKRKKC